MKKFIPFQNQNNSEIQLNKEDFQNFQFGKTIKMPSKLYEPPKTENLIIQMLPDEILIQIAQFLSPGALFRLSMCCFHLRKLIQDQYLCGLVIQNHYKYFVLKEFEIKFGFYNSNPKIIAHFDPSLIENQKGNQFEILNKKGDEFKSTFKNLENFIETKRKNQKEYEKQIAKEKHDENMFKKSTKIFIFILELFLIMLNISIEYSIPIRVSFHVLILIISSFPSIYYLVKKFKAKRNFMNFLFLLISFLLLLLLLLVFLKFSNILNLKWWIIFLPVQIILFTSSISMIFFDNFCIFFLTPLLISLFLFLVCLKVDEILIIPFAFCFFPIWILQLINFIGIFRLKTFESFQDYFSLFLFIALIPFSLLLFLFWLFLEDKINRISIPFSLIHFLFLFFLSKN
ncbi:dactylin [Anaeramoeba ignava]|uniref:Dactylin n=1 Tax=Anaeramoeba ignava TaxID=1746090 RepID=A0A9Q0L8E6_ANAIG|nr:dactylin [Anaeramoeba ignava]